MGRRVVPQSDLVAAFADDFAAADDDAADGIVPSRASPSRARAIARRIQVISSSDQLIAAPPARDQGGPGGTSSPSTWT